MGEDMRIVVAHKAESPTICNIGTYIGVGGFRNIKSSTVERRLSERPVIRTAVIVVAPSANTLV
jgi:hypothetical protein